MDTPVARPAIDGLHPVQFRPICLCHPTGDARSSFSAPFRPRSQWSGRHCSRRSGISKLERCSLTHSHLPRRRGALNTDQGSRFTSDNFTGTLKRHGLMISMDGKGRCIDNIFVERLWRPQIRGDLPSRLCDSRRGPSPHRRLAQWRGGLIADRLGDEAVDAGDRGI